MKLRRTLIILLTLILAIVPAYADDCGGHGQPPCPDTGCATHNGHDLQECDGDGLCWHCCGDGTTNGICGVYDDGSSCSANPDNLKYDKDCRACTTNADCEGAAGTGWVDRCETHADCVAGYCEHSEEYWACWNPDTESCELEMTGDCNQVGACEGSHYYCVDYFNNPGVYTGQWSSQCTYMPNPPESDCADGVDNDCDGSTDITDSDCDAQDVCQDAGGDWMPENQGGVFLPPTTADCCGDVPPGPQEQEFHYTQINRIDTDLDGDADSGSSQDTCWDDPLSCIYKRGSTTQAYYHGSITGAVGDTRRELICAGNNMFEECNEQTLCEESSPYGCPVQGRMMPSTCYDAGLTYGWYCDAPIGEQDCSDGLDNDCDGLTDNDDSDCSGSCTDNDGDGYYVEITCPGPVDCDDTDPNVNPGAEEICDNYIDDDCDGLADNTDPDCQFPCSQPPTCTDDYLCPGIISCTPQNGGTCPVTKSCEYTDPSPGVCEDEYLCPDGHYGLSGIICRYCCPDGTVYNVTNHNCMPVGGDCTDADGDGYAIEGGQCGPVDCDDTNASINPGAEEICDNGVDDDCDGLIDENDPDCQTSGCVDNDGDGYDAYDPVDCPTGDDCDDANPDINPGATELCTGGVDDDCDNYVDCDDNECATHPACVDCTSDEDCEPIWCPSLNNTINGSCIDYQCEYEEPVFGCITECSDDVDNDQDGYVDYDGGPLSTMADPGCDSFADDDEYNECVNNSDCVSTCPDGTPSAGWPWQGECVNGGCEYDPDDCQACHPYYYYYDYDNNGRLDGEDVSILVTVIFGSSCPPGRICNVDGEGGVDAGDVARLNAIIDGSYDDGEICDDLIDNNCNGLIDDEDPDCATCIPYNALYDYNDDGLMDGEDVSILTGVIFGNDCPDGKVCDVNDDGSIDAGDIARLNALIGGATDGENCADGIDNDCDGLTDGEDPDCDGQNTCADTDGGRNYLVQGTVTITTFDPNPASSTHTDHCIDDYTLHEYYCTGVELGEEQVDCPHGCQKGACQPPAGDICGEGIIHFDTETLYGWELLSSVDETTGIATPLRAYQGDFHAALAINDEGIPYSIMRQGGENRLVILEEDGSITSVGSLGVSGGLPSLAFSPEGRLYAINTAGESLYEIDPATGTATLLQSFSNFNAGGGDLIATSDDELLYLHYNGDAYRIYQNQFGWFIERLGNLPGGEGYTSAASYGGEHYILARNSDSLYRFTSDPFGFSLVAANAGPFSYGDAAACPEGAPPQPDCGDGIIQPGETCDEGGSLRLDTNPDTLVAMERDSAYDYEGEFSYDGLDWEAFVDTIDRELHLENNESANTWLVALAPIGDGRTYTGEWVYRGGSILIQFQEEVWGPIEDCTAFDEFTGGTLSCGSDCLFDTTECEGTPDPYCGDGIIQEGETCDGSEWGDIIGCTDFDNFTGGGLSCLAPGQFGECHFDTSECTTEPECTDADGDGYAIEGGQCGPVDCDDSDPDVNPGAEEICDNGIDDDCDGLIDGDDPDCPADECGDGVIVPGEQCDFDNTMGGTGRTLDEGETVVLTVGGFEHEIELTFVTDPGVRPIQARFTINGDLTEYLQEGDRIYTGLGTWFRVSLINATQRNGSATFSLSYQTPLFANLECTDFDNFTGGSLICDPFTCQINVSYCEGGTEGECGDGVINLGEQCDFDPASGDPIYAGLSCQDFDNFTSGELSCDELSCQINTSDCSQQPLNCTDADGDGYAIEGGQCGPVDCDDTNASINPGAEEICDNGVDDDCDGLIDGDDPDCPGCIPYNALYDYNDDGLMDGEDVSILVSIVFGGSCPPGKVCDVNGDGNVNAGDVARLNALIAGATDGENCEDGIDNDCDGLTDGEDPDCYVCGDGTIQPGETCDGNPGDPVWDWGPIDNCTNFDDYTGGTLSCDSNCDFDTSQCTGGNGTGVCGDGVINTGEQCDGNPGDPVWDWGPIDNCTAFDDFTGGNLLCDQSCRFDTGGCFQGANCTDTDGDGYAIEGGQCGPVDCDDTNASINPGAEEICDNGVDDDCDGLIDENDPDCFTCGDGIIQLGEQCDGANWGPITGCPDFDDFTGGSLTCDPVSCLFDTSMCTGGNGTGVCGDGVVNTGETCDGNPGDTLWDWGNITACEDFDSFISGTLFCGDACQFNTSLCELPPGPYCGDGTIDPGEQCEAGDNWGPITGCEDFDNFTGGELSCDLSTCLFNTSQCVEPEPFCGDGIIQPGEECDGSNWGPIENCTAFDDFTGGNLSCSDNCYFDTSMCIGGNDTGVCGDGVVNTGETCDGNPGDPVWDWGPIDNCTAFDDFTGGNLACGDNCQFDTDQCEMPEPFCGDGIIQLGEQCDGANWGPITGCPDFDDFTGGSLTCDSQTCVFDTAECNGPAQCGNGVINGDEECDGNDFGGLSCDDFSNYNRGSLQCRNDCTISTGDCRRSGGGGGGGGGGGSTYTDSGGDETVDDDEAPVTITCDADGDGYVRYDPRCVDKGLGIDCDDHDPKVHPGAPEICFNGKDDDCDGEVDEGCERLETLSYNSQISVPILSIIRYDVSVGNPYGQSLEDLELRLDLPSNWEYDGARSIGDLAPGEAKRASFRILVSEEIDPTQRLGIILEGRDGEVARGETIARVHIPDFAVRIKPSLTNYNEERDGEVYVLVSNKKGEAWTDLEVELNVNEAPVTDYVQYLGVFGIKPYSTFRYRYTYPVAHLRGAGVVVEGWLRQDGSVTLTSDDTIETVYHPSAFDKDARSWEEMRIYN